MDVGKAWQARHAFIEARVVFHCAGTEREQAGVDAVVLLAEPHVMTHRLGLAQARQSQWRAPGQRAEPGCKGGRLLDIDAGRLAAADFEDEAFLDGQSVIAAEGIERSCDGFSRRCRPALTVQHASTSWSALA